MVFIHSLVTRCSFKSVFSFLCVLCFGIFSQVSLAEYKLNFQAPVTEIAESIYNLHMLIFWVCVVIFVVVFGVMFYSIFAHRKSKNFTPATFSHNTTAEVIWTIIPVIILVAMAYPATKVLEEMEDTTKSDLTIKITGYQWKWGYEYLGKGIDFYSTLSTPRNQIDQYNEATAKPQGENYLLEVDKPLVVPSGQKVRALITANDVIHSWWVPAFGVKKDAVPGYINEIWFNVKEGKEGLYRGQCAELCGKDHAFMPIVVKVVTKEEFAQWVAENGEPALQVEKKATSEVSTNTQAVVQEKNVTAEKSVEITDMATLMKKGEQIAATRCASCHGAQGKGIPGVFPAIAGSAVATGPVDQHINVVMHGRSGTAMAAFANQLTDEELATVITYQRNAFGNATKDVVLPSDIQSKRQ